MSEQNQEVARVEHRPEMTIAGFRKTVELGPESNALWDEVSTALTLAGAPAHAVQQVGIIFAVGGEQAKFDYMAGVVVNDKDVAGQLNMNAAVVPAGEYAIVDVQGPAPLASATGMDYLLGVFLPERGLRATGPTLEVYGPGDTSAEDYMMQVWVPIKAL